MLCLGNVSKDFSAINIKKTGLYGTIYDFSVNYGAISVDNILSIHKYLIKNTAQYKMFKSVKQTFTLAMILLSCNLPSLNSLKCISVNNQKCKTRPQVVNVNGDDAWIFSI